MSFEYDLSALRDLAPAPPLNLMDEARLEAYTGFEAKIEAAIDAAWAEEKDFVRSRNITINKPTVPDEYDFTKPLTLSISCLAGPVERGIVENSARWIVFACPDDPALRTVRAYAESLKR